MILKNERKAEIIKFTSKELRKYLKNINYIPGNNMKITMKLVIEENEPVIGIIITQLNS